MTVITIKSDEARNSWRTLLDQVYAKAQAYIIERYKKPIAVLVSYERWEELLQIEQEQKVQIGLKRLDEIRDQPLYTKEELESLLDAPTNCSTFDSDDAPSGLPKSSFSHIYPVS
ncbi:MAG: type II toxin-antitoxin system Phd/YefM family antitoxin [Chloroflexota bacterium]